MTKSVFKNWVPNWLIVITLLLTVLTMTSVMGIYSAGAASAASYYGLDHTDIQYSTALFYAGLTAFFPLEKRLFNYFSSKTYFLMGYLVYAGLGLTLFFTQNAAIFLILRFLSGAVNVTVVSVVFFLIFQQFHSQRSRILGYAMFYGCILSSDALCTMLGAYVFENYDFNMIYLVIVFFQVPCVIMMFLILKEKIYLHQKRIPLYQIDWASLILYSLILCLVPYILLYGRYYGWFESGRITSCVIALLLLISLFVLRQVKLKRPFIDLRIYKYRNFKIGLVLLICFYISKGDMSISYTFFANNVHLDIYHQGYVLFFNSLGVIIGISLTARFILAGTEMRLIWLTGFLFLLIFHIYSIFLLGVQAEPSHLYIPLFFQGLGNGTLMLSLVIFTVTSVPPAIGPSASFTGISFRFMSFVASLSLISFMGLRQTSEHYNQLNNKVTVTNPQTEKYLQVYRLNAASRGATELQQSALSSKLMGAKVAGQTNLLFARDYYYMISILIITVMFAIAVIPNFHYRIKRIGNWLIPI